MEDHLTPDVLRRFFSGANSREENAQVVRHLVAGCKTCRSSLSALTESRWVLSRLLELPESRQRPLVELSYDWVFARVNRAISRLIEQAQRKDMDSISELLLLPRRKLLAEARHRLANREAIESLLAKAYEVRYDNPRMMLFYAELARVAAETCASAQSEALVGADLRVRALTSVANALRVNGRFADADQRFQEAERLWSKGNRDLRSRVLFLEKKATLRYYQRNFRDSIILSRGAAAVSKRLGDELSVARARVIEAISSLYSGDAEGSILLLNKAIPMIDEARDPQLFFAAHHNLAACYIDLGRPEDAVAVIESIRDLYSVVGEPGIRLKAQWQHGILMLEVGHLESAERFLKNARDGYLELDLVHQAADVSLMLAEVYRRKGETAKLRETLEETVPILRSFRFGPELLAALLRLQEAAQAAE